ncbi:MAG: acyl-CoA thioester hydrolase [Algoriphagus sp.]|jgi:acyl-CoA thioester hydrolase
MEEINKAFYKSELNIQWGDMDAAKHVNNTMYLRYSESARIGFYEKLKIGDLDFSDLSIILAWQDCKYIFPLTFPDTVLMTYDMIEIRPDRLIGECKMYSKKDQRISAIAKSTVMAYNYKELRKVSIPEEWKNALTDIYGKGILT